MKFSGFFKKKRNTDSSKVIIEGTSDEKEVIIEESPEEIKETSETIIESQKSIPDPIIESLLEPKQIDTNSDRKFTFDEFVDERILLSQDALGKKQMKIKILEVSDEKAPTAWKLGDRVKINKILVTIKHLESQEIEEGEMDIEAIEKELAEKRHYSSSNRWVPTIDIKNGYVTSSRHTVLISDAIALDYITF